jgi:membrane fusion protein (multidrug efflux system)
MPGMYVRALLSNAILQRGLLVPQQGVQRDAKGNASVMVVNGDDQVELREIQVSRTVGDQWLVDAGLEEGERVIVAGLQKVRPGVTVSVSEADIDVEKEAEAGVFPLDPEAAGDKTDSPWD